MPFRPPASARPRPSRAAVAVAGAAALVLVLASMTAGAGPRRAPARMPSSATQGLGLAGDALLAHRIPDARGGWTWASAIQRPHRQTDRDVGAASVATALLALHAVTGDARYLAGARRAGDWLLAVAQPDRGGLRWPDYVDPDGGSATHFSSFDDGAPGIADLLWRLGDATGDARYRRAAVAGMRWLARSAKGAGGRPCPERCRWSYYDGAADFRTGLGEGEAGIAYAFDVFAKRTGAPWLARYAAGAAAELEHLLVRHGALPERVGHVGFDTGYLSGQAGDAFLFLRMYRDTGDRRWLRDARQLLGWLRAHARREPGGGLSWPIEVGRGRQLIDDDRATGMEEGAAGIGWVFLQAWRATGDRGALATARAAGAWLRRAARPQGAGLAWPEDAGGAVLHTGLNNGAAGIGWFLDDLHAATGDRADRRAADRAQRWLLHVARRDARGPVWPEYHDHRGWHFVGEPSWHWGAAGIAGWFARRAGWPVDMPGEQEGLDTAFTRLSSGP